MRTLTLAIAAFLMSTSAPRSQTLSTLVYLSDLTETYATIGWGTLRKDASVSGTPIRLAGVVYGKGLGTHATSDIRYDLAASCSRFEATVGVDDAVTLGSLRFRVYGDGSLLFDSSYAAGGNLTGSRPGLPISVDVSGRRELRLLVSDGGDGASKDHADWADARVTCAPGALRPLRRTSYLSDLTPASATIGWGRIGKDRSVDGRPLTLNGLVFAKGIGTHAASEIHYALAGMCSRLDAIVGVDDEVARGSIRFQVFADGRFLYDSYAPAGGNMTGTHAGQPLSLDISAAHDLKLLVTDGGDGIGSDHADWANARITCTAAEAPPPPPPSSPPLPPSASGTATYLSDLKAITATAGWGTIRRDASVYGRPLTIGGVRYAKGIGTHAVSDIRYDLGRLCSRFQAVVGVDDEVTRGSIRFRVFGDGTLLYDSDPAAGGNVTGAHPGLAVSVDVSGRQQLRLYVTDGGDGIGSDHADWADARVTCTTPQPPPGAVTAAFAYWNVFGGNGVPRLAAANYARPDEPFTCRNTAGEPLDDRAYSTNTGAALTAADGAMTEVLVQQIKNDPAVVALGVSESWGAAETTRLLDILGWSPADVTARNFGDVILTRHGFTEQGMSPPIGQTGAEVHKALYANVCLDERCSRTLPFFAVHTQASLALPYDVGMATLLAYVDQIVPAGSPRLIMGDFNAWDRQTDPHVCVPGNEPGQGHEAGIRLIVNGGYTDLLRLKSPSGNRYTGMLNTPGFNQPPNSCTIAAGLPQGHPYKAIDHAYSRHLPETAILAAQRFGIPVGGYGNCAASDHLGLKVTVRVP